MSLGVGRRQGKEHDQKNGHRSGGGGALMFSSMVCLQELIAETTDAYRVYSRSNLTRKQKADTTVGICGSCADVGRSQEHAARLRPCQAGLKAVKV